MTVITGRILVHGPGDKPEYTQRIWFYSDQTMDHYHSATSPFATPRVAYPQAWQVVQAS